MDQYSRGSGIARSGLLLVAALFAFIYYETFVKLVEYWSSNDMYSYGFIVPFIAGTIVWLRWAELVRLPMRSSFTAGLVILGFGLAMLLAGRFASTNVLEELSLVVTTSGLVLLLFGRAIFRRLLFPIAYLLFMIPFWEFLTSRIHPYFQLYSATIGVGALRVFGLPVFQDGILIELPHITLKVAEACSGVNYLIAIFCVGVPLTHVFIRHWGKRLLIVCMAAMIALLSNGLRVAAVSFFAYYGIRGANGDIHGPLALFRSLLISGIGFVALFALISRFADQQVDTDVLWTRPTPPHHPTAPAGVHPASLIIAAAGLLFVGVTLHAHEVEPAPLSAGLRELPSRMGEWQRLGDPRIPNGFQVLRFDDTIAQHYTAASGGSADVLFGYFRRQDQGRELAGFDLRKLLTGRNRTSYVVGNGRLRVNDFFDDDEHQPLHLTYWYVLNGRVVSDDYRVKLYTAWNSFAHRDSGGAVVVVSAGAIKGESLDAARARVRRLIEGLVAACERM